MALIDELKERRERQTESLATIYEAIRERQEYLRGVEFELEDLDRAIAALEAPAQPLDELRTAPGAVEEVRDQLLTAFENDHIVERAPLIDAQTCEEVDPRCSWKAEQPEQDADANFDAPNGETHYDEGEEAAARTSEPDRGEPEPKADLWQQGYNDKLNGFEPSLSETDYLSGYEARAMIEREQNEGSTARMFAQGMMADADRHQSDQRSIVEKIGGLFKREREDA